MTTKPGFKTARELFSRVKREWLDAAVAITDGFDKPQPVERVSFHENADGGLLVLFHREPEKLALTARREAKEEA